MPPTGTAGAPARLKLAPAEPGKDSEVHQLCGIVIQRMVFYSRGMQLCGLRIALTLPRA